MTITSYVLGFCFNQALDKVVLVRKARPEWQRGQLNGVGGHIEPGETPRQAMRREFCEEVDWQATINWIPFGLLRGPDFEVHLFHGGYYDIPAPYNSSGDELVCAHHVSAVLSGRSQDTPVLPNVRYLLPMAQNHRSGADPSVFFEIVSKGSAE